jgi:hypothetical protein
MSDVDGRLEATRRALLKPSIFFAIGWLVIWIGLLGLNKSACLFIGWIIIGGPKMFLVMLGGFGAALKPDYEVVTYEGNTRVSSDGGAQSIQMNFIGRLIMIAIMAAIGGFLTIITLIFLTIKYIVLHIATSPKPAFVKSGLFIIVMNIAVFVGALIIGMVISGARDAARTAAYRAESGAKIIGDYDIRLNDTKDGIIIMDYLSKKGGDIVIPATFDGLPVVGLQGSFVFSEIGSTDWGKNNRNNRITSVSIPDTVTFISDGAFSYCTDLKQITLPKNLKFIGHYTFQETGLTSITIPEGVTDIGNTAFKNCANLTSVTLPRSLTRVGGSAFEDCKSLTDVTIPSDRTIKYGDYRGTDMGGSPGTNINGMGSHNFFVADEDLIGTFSADAHKRAFKGCTRLSASSRQAITDSGYIGAF